MIDKSRWHFIRPGRPVRRECLFRRGSITTSIEDLRCGRLVVPTSREVREKWWRSTFYGACLVTSGAEETA